MKRVVFLDQCLLGGGAQRVFCTIMRSLDPKSYDIHLVLVSNMRDLKHLIPSHVTIHELGITNTRKALGAYRKKIGEIKPQVVYTTTSRTAILAILGRVFKKRHKVIARYPNMPSFEVENGLLSSWRLILTKLVYRHTDVVIAQSDEMAAEVTSYYKLDAAAVHVIPNPVDRAHITECLRGAESPFNSDYINIVASGQLVRKKGFDVLLKSFAALESARDKAMLHILGDDVWKEKHILVQLAEDLGISDRVHFHGFVSNPYPYYKYCDLFVLSSRWEGCPNVLLENLFIGSRVAATRCVPIVERLVPEGQGKLAEVEDPQSLSQAMMEALELPKEHGNSESRHDSIGEFISLFE
jgi:glycosyltransferase involved in cell wall biosynthesis